MTGVRQTQQEVASFAGFQPKLGPLGGCQDKGATGSDRGLYWAWGRDASIPDGRGSCLGPGGPAPTRLLCTALNPEVWGGHMPPEETAQPSGRGPEPRASASSSVKLGSTLGGSKNRMSGFQEQLLLSVSNLGCHWDNPSSPLAQSLGLGHRKSALRPACNCVPLPTALRTSLGTLFPASSSLHRVLLLGRQFTRARPPRRPMLFQRRSRRKPLVTWGAA